MTARTARMAAVGAGSLLALGLFTSPAFAADGTQAGASVSAGTADAISQTIDVVDKACADAANVTGTATSTASSVLGTDSGITLAAQPANAGALNLSVSLPALTRTLSGVSGLPIVGSLATTAQSTPLSISCAASGNGTGLGLSAAGVDALVNAIAPGVDLSGIELPAGLSLSAGGGVEGPASSGSTAGASSSTGQASATTKATAASPAVRKSASAAPATAAATTLSATPASSTSGGIVAQTVGSPGALARTGAGISLLALLGTALFGSGRLFAFSRRLLRIG